MSNLHVYFGNKHANSAALSAETGAFVLSGRPTQLNTTVVLSVGNFGLTAADAVAYVTFAAESGSFALTAPNMVLDVELGAAQAPFSLTVPDTTANVTLAADACPLVLRARDAGYSVDYALGSTILQRASGGLSRRRWRELIDGGKAARVAERRSAEKREQAARRAAVAAAWRARDAVLAARAVQAREFAERTRIRELTAALGGIALAEFRQDTTTLANALRAASQAARTQQAQQDDEDTALILLLAHH